VRISNIVAQNLYKKHGFIKEGIRKNYYADTHEDGVIMWKYNLQN
jgi:ribosomal-protein-alanine N-acetyltransferase